jgi:CHAT domain-containing protein
VCFNNYLQSSSGRARPRILLCPTGVFSHVPLHAAGATELNETVGLTDYVVPSYTPTLGAVLSARQGFSPIRKTQAKVLLACVPEPFQWAPLPLAKQEILDIQALIPDALVLTELELQGEGATAGDVLNQLPQATILHLACHGYQNLENPLDSGFVMRDRMLTLSELMDLRLPHAFLAFLSACETARGDSNQPDQAVHLAAAMLFAGFRSVIGTMW